MARLFKNLSEETIEHLWAFAKNTDAYTAEILFCHAEEFVANKTVAHLLESHCLAKDGVYKDIIFSELFTILHGNQY